MNPGQIPLITTDGFEFYKKVIGRIFGPACLYGQVIKTRRNDRIVKIERRTVIGGAWRLQQVLRDSEDSSRLNTSFIERLNLTIRQGREIFSSTMHFWALPNVTFVFFDSAMLVDVGDWRFSMAA
jgi:hypothetical protein